MNTNTEAFLAVQLARGHTTDTGVGQQPAARFRGGAGGH